MNTTQTTQPKNTSRFAGIRGLGRGIALSSAVAVMGVSTLSAGDANAAGVSQGVRHVAAANVDAVKPGPTDLRLAGDSQLVVRTDREKKS